jgi:hypothetical protein
MGKPLERDQKPIRFGLNGLFGTMHRYGLVATACGGGRGALKGRAVSGAFTKAPKLVSLSSDKEK